MSAAEIIVPCRRTSMSPPPGSRHVYGPPGLWPPRAKRVLISCTFTWDKPRAKWLAAQWRAALPEAQVQVGGPAYGDPGGDFEPGKFLRPGVVITTRGCPGCPSPCLVPKREGPLRCLMIKPGWIVQDNNILAAPDSHIRAVLDMLREQPQPVSFPGGLEARRLLQKPWFIAELAHLRLSQVFLAYDYPEAREPVMQAIRELRSARLPQRKVRCYVLVGRNGDTPEAAARRLQTVFDAGGLPFAMLWRGPDEHKRHHPIWHALVRKWTRPAAMLSTGKPCGALQAIS